MTDDTKRRWLLLVSSKGQRGALISFRKLRGPRNEGALHQHHAKLGIFFIIGGISHARRLSAGLLIV